MTEIINPIIIFTVGAIAGFINIMAGGGSTLTLGAMVLMGLDAAVANGTNRIGILIETISASAAYKSKRFGNLKKSLLKHTSIKVLWQGKNWYAKRKYFWLMAILSHTL